MMDNQEKWDRRFMSLAREVSTWSKDPSTKVGAAIVRDRKVVGLGYNGLPRGVHDWPERYEDRETKYKMVVHAEANAILNAISNPQGATIYVWPLPPCHECAKLIIQAGIQHVVSLQPDAEQYSRWRDSFHVMTTMFNEANVEWRVLANV